MRELGKVPKEIAKLLVEYNERGALVGCVCDINDAWDIVVSDENNHKRKRRTYAYKKFYAQYVANRKNQDEETE
jgi:hypothetical protein